MGGAAALAGGVLFPSALRAAGKATGKAAAKRTAVDQVTLGKTGLKLSRLGIGTGSRGGSIQRKLGKDAFIRLLRYAYDRGIRYIDTADSYRIQPWVGEAIKGLPRERLYIQSKVWGIPQKPGEVLDRFRKELGVDYIDSVLVHCVVTKTWDKERAKVMDALAEAKQKGIIRAHGFSCHTIPALARATEVDWVNVGLVRINPQGVAMDTVEKQRGIGKSGASSVPLVVKQVERLRKKRCGVIGMKIIGNGNFTKPADREKSIRFAMQCGLLDAIVIGFKSPAEIDEAIERMNRALAAPKAARIHVRSA
jgi:hypothetical protein